MTLSNLWNYSGQLRSLLSGGHLGEGTGHDGAVAKSSPNGPVGIGFASRYQLQLRAGF